MPRLIYAFVASTSLFLSGCFLDSSGSSSSSSKRLVISEVGAAPFATSMNWFEVYNPSKIAVNLSDFSLKAPVAFGDCFSIRCNLNIQNSYSYILPDLTIEPGQYAVIRAQHWFEQYDDSDRMVYLGDDQTHLYWENKGFLELLNANGSTMDFIVFGDWGDVAPTPSTESEWSGDPAVDLPYQGSTEADYSVSLSRNALLLDRNNASDWDIKYFNTPGGPNDVNCNTDLDEDGLPDCSEQPGTSYSGIDLYALGARVNQPDIFIEIDYMDSQDEGVIPRIEALEKIVDVFSTQGVAVHFDVGDLFDSAEGLNTSKFDLGGGNLVPFSGLVNFDPSSNNGVTNFFDVKQENFHNSRLPIFHYLLMSSDQEEGAGGVAELSGNDIIIALGNLGLNSWTSAEKNLLINTQASTIMHELGHNLGLMHGGDEEVNLKPNYTSIMNYLYSYKGLSEVGNYEGDRYIFDNCAGGRWPLVNSPIEDTNSYKLDYSHGYAADLNEGSIFEINGLGYVNSNAIDFNCNSEFDLVSYSRDLNNDGKIEVLSDYDDWGSIELRFQHSYWSHLNLKSSNAVSNENELNLLVDKVGNDRTKVVVEKNIKQMFEPII